MNVDLIIIVRRYKWTINTINHSQTFGVNFAVWMSMWCEQLKKIEYRESERRRKPATIFVRSLLRTENYWQSRDKSVDQQPITEIFVHGIEQRFLTKNAWPCITIVTPLPALPDNGSLKNLVFNASFRAQAYFIFFLNGNNWEIKINIIKVLIADLKKNLVERAQVICGV